MLMALGIGHRFSLGAWNGTFTDDLTGSVTLSTSIATRQVYQRGRSSVVLAGTYSVTGGEPTGMAWRVGSGAWRQFANETIGSDAWEGTLAIPADYLAQGTLQIKPINGDSVTPAEVSNITVTDIIVFNGQSNANGAATNNQTYTKTNFDFLVKPNGGAWGVKTTDPIWSSVGSLYPALAELIDAAGIPPAFMNGATTPGTGFAAGDWNPGDTTYATAVSRLDAALTASGGCLAAGWHQGESDAGDLMAEQDYFDAVVAMLDGFDAEITNWTGTPTYITLLAERPSTGTNAIRAAQKRLAAGEDSRCRKGPHVITEDCGDDLHYGDVSGNVDSTEAEAQIDRFAASWYRALYGSDSSAPTVTAFSIGSGASADELTLTFDRAMENHSYIDQWTVEDAEGARTVLSGAQGASANQLVLTVDQALYGATLVSFGENTTLPVPIEDVAAQFREATAINGVKYAPDLMLEVAAGNGPGIAPALSVSPSIGGASNVGGTATATNGTYTGIPAPTVGSFQWQVSDDGSTGWTDISGATSASYVIDGAYNGKYIRRGEVASSGAGTAARAYTPASDQIINFTLVVSYATDGTSTSMNPSNASWTTAYADNDGGNDAVLLTDNNAGTSGTVFWASAARTWSENSSVFKVRLRVKAVAHEGAKAWLRIGWSGLTVSSFAFFDITDDATADVDRDGSQGSWTGGLVESEGDGWFYIEATCNIAGADITGTFICNVASADGTTSVPRNGGQQYAFHDVLIGY